ncbi:hypothetical protein JR316_0010905 [Psilocybe cubensis]|uniref:Uncharacterized protein n=1 Tax=Psilocybe cubensis TaxID=181762 RepID=A0ACB8GPM8_PSICU|nr:hypothetical protein JR316_0010905 [Psilocybe cubensis]KAH9476989.1 hypothetical protein JR316_0010905 [Psilocybe cubensis]
MLKLVASLLLLLFVNHITVASGHVAASFSNSTVEAAPIRCADPRLTNVYVQSYSPSGKFHLIQMSTEFVDSLTVGNGDFGFQGNIFRAWNTPQPSTFPLYRLVTPPPLDYLFVLSTDGNAPAVPGYHSDFIPAYIYSTQICNSIPLYSATRADATDHYYTTVLSERDDLINRWGWTDSGIIGYVLPLTPVAELKQELTGGNDYTETNSE